MPGSFDILLVALEEDRVAAHLRHSLEEVGCRVYQADGLAAARIFTIRVLTDCTVVDPAVPMFVRPTAWPNGCDPSDLDERFLIAEACSTVWAAAALSETTVINRPGSFNPIRGWTGGRISSALALLLEQAPREIYASGPEMLTEAELSGQAWIDRDVFFAASVSLLPPRNPLQVVPESLDSHLKVVTVVGRRAFLARQGGRIRERDLLQRSIALAEKANVQFCAIGWTIGGGATLPVYFNAAPDESDLGQSFDEVIKALCEELTH